ncbi:serine/threonine protein kinase [bacterium]|nr:serine/threonine protein kinase [bacterium]
MSPQRIDTGFEIDGFTLVRELGSGAMGRVYLAKQNSPQRHVAIKLLSRSGPEMASRFRREADLLARLEHPNIARIYETGEAQVHGAPTQWIAMEYVEGDNLRDYCADKLPDKPTERVDSVLALIRQIGRGLQAAHTKGVIHRDLKPENIHVTPAGIPKILDFGLAQLVGDEAMTAMTRDGEILGTVPYMSWEQLTGDYQQLDGRSDLYSLGAIAYELVGRQAPYPGLSQVTLVGAVERLSRESPKRLGKIDPHIPDDADTLIMKALAREPEQRYATVGDFVADIERYLRREAIKARPPTAAYLASTFVRRHKALSATAALSALILLIAALVSLGFAVNAKAARDDAELRLAQNKAITDFLETMLTSANPDQSKGEQLSVRDLLDAATRDLANNLTIEEPVRLNLLRTIGSTYLSVGEADAASEMLSGAYEQATQSDQIDTLQRTQIALTYANALNEFGRYDDALALLQAQPDLSAARSGSLSAKRAAISLRKETAQTLANKGQVQEATARLERLLAEARKVLPDNDQETLSIAYILATAYNNLSRDKDALPLIRTLIAGSRERYGPTHSSTLDAEALLGATLFTRDAYTEAAEQFEAVLALQIESIGPDAPGTQLTRLNASAALASAGDPELLPRASSYARESLEAYKRLLEPGHSKIMSALNILSYIEQKRGNYDVAETLLRDAISTLESSPSAGHTQNTALRNNLGMLLLEQGMFSAAQRELELAIEKTRAALGDDHVNVAIWSLNLADCLRQMEQFDQAEAVIGPAHSKLLDELGAEHPRTAKAQRVQDRIQARNSEPL